jgi:TolA-binding protein
LAGDQPPEIRASRESRYGRSKRSPGRNGGRTSDPQRLLERLREEPEADNLEEHDYEILSMMADGIRPILDRLDEIEGRVGQMETGEEPVPSNVRGWLNNQIADTFEGRESKGEVALGRTVSDLEARLPQLIEQAVTNRFHNMAAKLQQEIEETHVRTLETFVKNIQVKLVQRVSALETDMSKQAEAMHQLREYSQRTEDNLSRLITGVDKLAQELPKRLAGIAPEQLAASAPELKVRRRRTSPSFSAKRFWIAVATVVVIVTAAWKLTSLKSGRKDGNATASATASFEGAPGKLLPTPAASADTKTRLQAAQDYTERKDYAMAEDLYKQVIKTEPANAEALRALASVLYREDKIEESAAILDKLPRN